MISYLIIKLLHLEKLDQGGLAEVGEHHGLGVVRQSKPFRILGRMKDIKRRSVLRFN